MAIHDTYNSPTDVMIDKSINQDEKIKILESWCEDEEGLIRASAEGMAGGEQPHLKQAKEALETLKDAKG